MQSNKNPDRKKALFITYHLPLPEEAGACRPWMEARLMALAGYDVTVLTAGTHYLTGEDIKTNKGIYSSEERDGITILKVWTLKDHRKKFIRRIGNYVSFAFFAFLVGLLKTRSIDRIFAGTDPIFIMPSVYLLSLFKRCSLILDERDLYPENAVIMGLIKNKILIRFLELMQGVIRKHSRFIVAATPGIKRELLKYNIPENKLSCMYNADVFIEEDFKKDPGALLDYKAEIQRPFTIFYSGGLGQSNDIPTILSAALLLKDIKELGFVIIGMGERLEDYRRFCRENEIDNVFFFNPLSRITLRHTLSQADMCIHALPNHVFWEMALSSKVFDYLAVGKTIVFSGRGDIPDLLEASKAGVFVPPEEPEQLAETIRKLYSDEDARKKMGENGIKWFKENINVNEYVEQVKKAIEN